jgi:hypothetical protein
MPLAVAVGSDYGIALGLPVTLVGVVDRYYGSVGPPRGVVASRLAPIPSNVSTCAAAIGDVRPRQFLLGTLIGDLPWTVAGVVVASTPTLGK